MKVGISHPVPLLEVGKHAVPRHKKNEAGRPGRPQQGLAFQSTHFLAADDHAELRQLNLPLDRQSDVYGHVFGAGANDNAACTRRVGNGQAALIRALGDGPESAHARGIHDTRFDQLGQAATSGNTIHGKLESIWSRGRAFKSAANNGIHAWAVAGAMPEVAMQIKVRVRHPEEGDEAGREMSLAGVLPSFGSWSPPVAMLGGLAAKKGINLVHDWVQPKYFTSIGARREDLEGLAERFRANAKVASDARAGSAGAGIVKAYGEDGRDYLEHAMNETDRSAYDYMKAMQRPTRWAQEPDQHLVETGATSAAIQVTVARLAEARFLNTFAGRGDKAQPVVHVWTPPEHPEAGDLIVATDPLIGTPPANGRARKDVPAADRPQRWDYRPAQGAVLAEVGKLLVQIPSWGDYALAQRDFVLAKSGNRVAQVRLGEMSEQGRLGTAQGQACQRMAEELYDGAARLGDKQAQYRLGRMHAEGRASMKAGRQSDRLAAEWLEKAAVQGHHEAQAELGLLHAANRTGLDKQASGSQACLWLRRAVQGGVRAPNVLFALGHLHEKRRGDVGRGDQPTLSAEKWYGEAAKAGHVEAFVRLGLLHYRQTPGLQDGSGNDAAAAKFLGQAKDQGHPKAAYYLGLMYFEGRAQPEGETPLKDAMLDCLEQAAAGAYLKAQVMLGRMLAVGEVAPRHGEPAGQAAAWWLLQAACRGDKDAQCGLADLYRDKRARPEGGQNGDAAAVHWYKLAAAQRSETAWLALAGMHAAGRAGIERGPQANRKVVECLEKVAVHGDRELQFQLAERYRKGTAGLESGPAGDAMAAKWYTLAAAQGHVEAKYLLGQFHRDGRTQPVGAEPKSPAAKEEAACLFEEAFSDGHVLAGFELGEMLLESSLEHSDAAKEVRYALDLMRPAAEQGNPDRQYRLGMGHLQRKADTPAETQERDRAAQKWLQAAANQDHLKALRQLASLHIEYRTECSTPELANQAAMACIQKAADSGDRFSLARLGWMYEVGRAGIASPVESQCMAVTYYTRATEGDNPHPFAMRQLAIMGMQGRGGIEQGSLGSDTVQLLQRAAELGDGIAMHALGMLHARGVYGLAKDVAPNGAAVRWLEAAVKRGVKAAQDDLQAVRAGEGLG